MSRLSVSSLWVISRHDRSWLFGCISRRLATARPSMSHLASAASWLLRRQRGMIGQRRFRRRSRETGFNRALQILVLT